MDEQDPLTAYCRARVGRVLNAKWHLDQLIGIGGMAAVYAGSHRNGARAAIKILHSEMTHHGEARERFLREAYIANRVEHPGTVKALDDDVTEQGEPYLVMELLVGESVDARAQRYQGCLPLTEALWIADRTLAVLELAHAAGIVHRDLKPENLFLTDSAELKVLDFGIARLREGAGDKRTQTGMMMGTPAFMAPEQAMARWSLVDSRTDLWAVGAVVFTLLTGRHVHDAPTMNETLIRAATQPAPSLARILPGAQLNVVKLVDRALAFDQHKRFNDATSMRASIAQLTEGLGISPCITTPPPQASPLVQPQASPLVQPAQPPTSDDAQPDVDPRIRSVVEAAKARRQREGSAATFVGGPPSATRDPRAEPDQDRSSNVEQVEISQRSERPSVPTSYAQTSKRTVRGSSRRPARSQSAPPASPTVQSTPPTPAIATVPATPIAPPEPIVQYRGDEKSSEPVDRAPSEPVIPSTAPSSPPTVSTPPVSPSLAPAESGREQFDAGAYEVANLSDADKQGLQDLFTAMDRAMVTRRQYGSEHAESVRRMDKAFSICASAVMHSEAGLLWNVTPYSFVAGGVTLWEPAAPLDQVPYQLFSDGVRTLGFLPGLTEGEFSEFLRMVTLERTTEVAPEDDLVTLLWEARFDHVVHEAIDSLSEGDQETRAQFALEQGKIVSLARCDTSAQLEECWAARPAKQPALSVEGRRQRIATLLTGSEPTDTESIVQALSLKDGVTSKGADTAGMLQVDEHTLAMLRARLEVDTSATGERFVLAVVRAYEDATDREATAERITAPIRAAVDGLATSKPEMALELVRLLCASVAAGGDSKKAEVWRASLAAAIVSRKTFEKLLTGATMEGAQASVWTEGLRMLLGYLGKEHIKPVLAALPAVRDPDIQGEFVAYLRRVGQGHETQLGALFADANVELGLALVRVLAEIPTPEAKDAISQASHSTHAVVRIEALSHVEGASGERMRLELRSLIQDREPEVRLVALRTMKKYRIRAAGPFLVLLIRESSFDSLPAEERRQALETVEALAPARAEALCVQVLSDAKLLGSEARDKSREFAAEVLGRVARSQEAMEALEKLSTSRWRTSDSLRRTCQLALETARSRLSARKQATEPSQ